MKRRNKVILGAGLGLALLAGQAQAVVFLGTNAVDGTTDFVHSNNWTGATYPTTGEYASINTVADMTNAAPNGIRALRIGESSSDVGVLNLYEGADLPVASHTSWDTHIGQNGHGTLNVLGGTVGINFVEVGRNAGSTGIVNVVSGYFRGTRGSRDGRGYSVHLGSCDNHNNGGYGVVEVTGGEFRTRFGIEVGSTEIATGIGLFSVQGTNPVAVIIGDTNDGRWQQNSNSTLRVGIGPGGVTPIEVKDFTGGDGNGEVRFEEGAILDVDFIGSSQVGTWTVMTTEGTMVNLGLELSASAVAAGWNAGIEGNVLRVAFGEDAPGDLEPPTTPLAPASLVAHPTAAYEASMVWTAAEGADTYTVKRSETMGGPYTDVATGLTGLAYTNSGLSAYTMYYYKVVGVNAFGEGLPSTEESAYVLPYTIITFGDPYNDDFTVYNAFDTLTSTHYDGETDDAWIGWDLGAGNAQQVKGVGFVLRNWGSSVQYATNATFEGANDEDFSDAVVLHTVAEPLEGNPNWNYYEVSDATAYRYVRLMTAPQLRSKSFAEVKFLLADDFTSNGTLKGWLDIHYDVDADFGGDYDAADTSDTDLDGLMAWEEYVAGTDPTDGASVLELNSIANTTNGLVLTWQSVEGKNYSVLTNTSLTVGTPGTEATVTGLDGETSYTGTVNGAGTVFYEIGVE